MKTRDSVLAPLLDAHESLEAALRAHGRAVFAALAKQEPELCAEVLQLFGSVDLAAQWVVTAPPLLEGSPARLVIQGDRAEAVARLRRIAHGFPA